jgi:hypothetical protein
MEQHTSTPTDHVLRSALRRLLTTDRARRTVDKAHDPAVAFSQAEQALAGAGIAFSVVQLRGPAATGVSRLAPAA